MLRDLLFLIGHDVLCKDSLLGLFSLELEGCKWADRLFIELARRRLIVLTGADPVWCIFARMMVHAHVHGVRHAAATPFDIFLYLRAVLLRLILKKQLHSLLLLIDLVSSFRIDVRYSSHFNTIILLICILKSVLVKVYRRWSETLRSSMV